MLYNFETNNGQYIFWTLGEQIPKISLPGCVENCLAYVMYYPSREYVWGWSHVRKGYFFFDNSALSSDENIHNAIQQMLELHPMAVAGTSGANK